MSKEEYLENKVTPILEPLINDIYLTGPSDLPGFCLRWLKNRLISPSEKAELESLRKQLLKIKANKQSSDSSSDSSSELDELPVARRNTRVSVSAEAYGTWNKPVEYVAKEIPKSEEQIAQIVNKLGCSFIFSALDQAQKIVVAKAMERKTASPGQPIIVQGEDGNSLFFVESGKLECFKTIQNAKVFLKTYHPNEAFGELALLYNVPRAASITASEASVLWELDRETFNHIVKMAAIKQREHFEEVLAKIDILQGMDNYDRVQLADGLKTAHFKTGELVIRQGDWGDVFYLIEEGNAVAMKKRGEEAEEEVLRYAKGDYFGELALIRGQPRAASVIATTELKCLTLDRQSFTRLLGPLQDLLASKAEQYK
jgi:cAMP-dependent protein kinase regulator